MSKAVRVRTVGDLKKELARFPDDMLLCVSGDPDPGKAVISPMTMYPPVRKTSRHTHIPEGYKFPCESMCSIGEDYDS